MRSFSGIGRIAAVGAVIAACALVALLLFGGGPGDYEVKARFLNAGQLVKGNPVQTGGVPISSNDGIEIAPNGEAELTLEINDGHAPLRRGTQAAIRQLSQSGIANRYVDLSMPPNGSREIPDGGTIGSDDTTTQVDLDQLFNTLDAETRANLQKFFKGSAEMFKGQGEEARAGFHYLNPALSTSSRLFNELTRDTPVLERFLVDSAKLVNLRSTLDEVDPLVNASEPVAKRLGPFLSEARAFAADAEPTVRDLSRTVRRGGPANDLINLLDAFPPLADIAVKRKGRSVAPGGRRVSVGVTDGAFQETVEAFQAGAPEIALGRAYTTDFLGWADDFSTTGGGFDALGTMGRGHISFAENLGGPIRKYQYKRCPGAAEAPAADGSNVWSEEQMAEWQCEESARATGDVR